MSDMITRRTKQNECWFCEYGQQPPNNAHFYCSKPDPDMTGKQHGIDNGWFDYPDLFDPVWKQRDCKNFEQSK